MKKIILTVFIIAFSNASHSNEQAEFNQFVTGALSMGEFTGRCGVYKRQMDFIKATKLESSERLFNEFWNNEAANVGLSIQEYKSKCEAVFVKFQEFKKDFDTVK